MDRLTQKSSSPQQPTRSGHPFKAWTVEILSALLAIGSVLSIVSILAHFDGQTQPEWRYTINLNTLVALLSTVARALILVTVSEVLGQAKWLWISQRESRPVSHLEDFDIASRGWFGSFRLLTILSRNPLAVSSCLVVILSLAMGSFTQQAIKTTTCPQNSKEFQASIHIAHHMGFPKEDMYTYITGPGVMTIPADMKGAMADGLVNYWETARLFRSFVLRATVLSQLLATILPTHQSGYAALAWKLHLSLRVLVPRSRFLKAVV